MLSHSAYSAGEANTDCSAAKIERKKYIIEVVFGLGYEDSVR